MAERGLDVTAISLDRRVAADEPSIERLRSAGVKLVYVMDPSKRRLVRLALGWALGHPLAAARALLLNARAPIPSYARKLPRWLKLLAVLRVAERRGLDRLHSHWTVPTDVALLARKVARLPFSISAHAVDIYDDPTATPGDATPGGLPEKLRSADFVATCTAHNRSFLHRLAPDAAETIDLVYHGIDLTLFDGDKQANGGPPLILSVGRLIPKKGFMTMVECCAELRDRGVAFRAAIVGDGPQRDELQAAIDARGLSGAVELVGPKAHAEVRDLLRRADVFFLAPEADQGHYGIPNVLFEALAMRTVAVVKRMPGIEEELITGEDVGIVFDRPEEAVERLERLLCDADARGRMGEAGRRRIEARFDADRTIDGLLRRFAQAAGAP